MMVYNIGELQIKSRLREDDKARLGKNFSFKPICFLQVVPHASLTSTSGGHVTNLRVLKINMTHYFKKVMLPLRFCYRKKK